MATGPDAAGALTPPGDPHQTSMVDSVYATMLSAIVETRLGAGTPLSQNKLASHLGVSRTPVREALLRLERDGLVQRTSDMGFVVATITPQEVHEACDLLKVLDTFVYLRAARAMSREDLEDLLALATGLVASADAGDTDGWKRQDLRYHAAVMDAASNRYVADYLEQTRRRVQRFWMAKPDFAGRLRSCSQDHIALARAMVDGDDQVLTDLVHAHIERLRESVIARLESAGPLLPAADPLAGVLAPRAAGGNDAA
jgi:GntR family transcriptional regulator, rspAB operon transcriptional repressor